MFYKGEIVEVKGFATFAEVIDADQRKNKVRVILAGITLSIPFSQCSLVSHIQREAFLNKKKLRAELIDKGDML